MCLAFAPATFAQTVNGDQNNNTQLYLPNVNLTGLSQNGFTGIVGGIFYTPYFYNVSENYLGYADPNDAPLAKPYHYTLGPGQRQCRFFCCLVGGSSNSVGEWLCLGVSANCDSLVSALLLAWCHGGWWCGLLGRPDQQYFAGQWEQRPDHMECGEWSPESKFS